MFEKEEPTAFTVKAKENTKLLELRTRVNVCQSKKIVDVNKACNVYAVWDTGANKTSISPKIVSHLNLIPIGRTIINTASETLDVDTYLIDLFLTNQFVVNDVIVSVVPNLNNCDVLIGMDIITLGDFCISNAGSTTCFSFRLPSSDNHTDYVYLCEKQYKNREKRKRKRK